MIATERLAYVHTPKTGGSWVTEQLRVYLGGYPATRGHLPARCLEADVVGDRLVFGTIRNPWAWYASWFFHAMRTGTSLRERVAEYGRGSLEFRDVLYGVTHPSPETTCLTEEMAGPGVFFRAFAPVETLDFATGDLGLYSWTVRNMYRPAAGRGVDKGPAVDRNGTLTGWLADAFLDLPSVRRTLPALAHGVGERARPAKGTKPMPNRLDCVEINTAKKHGAAYVLEDLYDTEMIEWVRQADSELIEAFGYTGLTSTARAETLITDRGVVRGARG